MNSLWKDIPGYNGRYQADMEGNIRRIYQGGAKLVKPFYRYRKSGNRRVVVKLTKKGEKSREITLVQVIARTFLGDAPKGYVSYHINGCQTENHVNNIAYIERSKLGRMTGAMSKRQPVVKIDKSGEIVEAYPSARECADNNFLSHQTVCDRCNEKCKSVFAPDGYAYAWENKEASLKRIIARVEDEANGI